MATVYFKNTKEERIANISQKTKISQAVVARVIEEYHIAIERELREGQSVNINGIVTLTPRYVVDEKGNATYKIRARTSTTLNEKIANDNDYTIKSV